MTYREQYYQIIDYRKQNPVPKTEYSEKHHIVPKSLGGANTKDNLVRLTAAEHYKVHCILPYMYLEEGNKNGYIKMLHAWQRLSKCQNKGNPDFSYVDRDSEEYAKLKKQYAELRRLAWTGRTVSEETRKKLSAAHIGVPPSNKGKKATPEQIEINRKSHLGGHHSEETKMKMSAKRRGMKWWNNGVSNKRSRTCPKGYVPGILPRK